MEHHGRLILKLFDQYKVCRGHEKFVFSFLNQIPRKNDQYKNKCFDCFGFVDGCFFGTTIPIEFTLSITSTIQLSIIQPTQIPNSIQSTAVQSTTTSSCH